MARALPQALPRPHGFALLRPASRPQLDSARIVTLSGTIAINLIAMGLLMMPLSAPPPALWQEPRAETQTRWLRKDPPKVEMVRIVPPAAAAPRTPVDPPAVVTRPSTVAAVASAAVITESGTARAVDSSAAETSGPAIESILPAATGPAPVQLEYARAPAPTYPRTALRLGLTGTVMLQVLVGIDGRPLEVTVVQSSGHRALDDAARAQVLKRWSFRPATRDGVAIQALGMVPVQFSLQR